MTNSHPLPTEFNNGNPRTITYSVIYNSYRRRYSGMTNRHTRYLQYSIELWTP